MQHSSSMTASLTRNNFRFFGVDLAAVVPYLRDGWAEALQWPVFSWLTPDDAVRVIHADGSESTRRGASANRIDGAVDARFTALALAEDSLLRRSLLLPSLSNNEVQQAASLDAHAASPFAEQDLLWGFVADRSDRERVRVDIALTSRKLVDEQLAAQRKKLEGLAPEIWADGARPIVMPGYGESSRSAQAHKTRRLLLLLLALAAIQAVALAITPPLQSRQLAIEATSKFDDLQRKVQPQTRMRDEIAKLGEQARLLTTAGQDRHDVVALLDEITRRLPDDAVLSRLEISGSTVRLSGQADNAAQLLQTLGANSAFRDVRAPGGIARAQAGGKESFTIEFNLGAGPKSS